MVRPFATQNEFLTPSGSLGHLTKILRESHQDYVMERLIGLFNGKEDELRDVAGLGEEVSIPCHNNTYDSIQSIKNGHDKYT